MEKTDVIPGPKKRQTPWWAKALQFAFSLTVISSIFLGWTGYPSQEWPFVAGVFAVVMFLCTLIVTIVLLLAVKVLSAYRRAVSADAGIDLEAEDAKVAARVGLRVGVNLVVTLLYLGAVWGLALNVSLAVFDIVGMPAFVSSVNVVAVVLTAVGFGGFAGLIGLSFAAYYLIRRLDKRSEPLPWVFRLVFNLVRGVENRAESGSIGGSSLRAGVG